QLCCYNNHLPQGAPTSPVISNMICSRMDFELQGLAKKHKCTYSRYADDLTISTSIPFFPQELATLRKTDTGLIVEVGKPLRELIESNGFEINEAKLALQRQNWHQEVTGLTVNVMVN